MTTIIIGAGASGLACAIRLKLNNPNCSVTVLERMPLAGKKILATGNGRCNLSNINADNYKEVTDFFSSIGLVTRADDEGRIYPYSNQAATVVDILVDKCNSLGVEIITECTVTDIDRKLCVTTDRGVFTADNVVIAAGGKAQKNLGSNGSGCELLKSLGHSITQLYPALVQLTSSGKYPRLLKGHRVKCNMAIQLDGLTVKEEYGEVLFTDYGLSGIVTMNLSEIVSKNFLSEQPKKCHAVLDLIPDMSETEITKHLTEFHNLKGILGADLSSIIEKQAQGNISKTAKYAKNWKLIITGTKGYEFAQITGGGAKLNEFDGFRSRLVKGLYACGEVLDKQFMCGGYNLNFAWYSGIKTADEITDNI
ncbi:MAG: aminoacetone oxidase family FAD-binding enzyme [Eubacterium sp.]